MALRAHFSFRFDNPENIKKGFAFHSISDGKTFSI